jgi:hypothetical protein
MGNRTDITKAPCLEPPEPASKPLWLAPSRLAAPIPEVVDLGDVIVGSDHWYEIAPLALAPGFLGEGVVTSFVEGGSSTSHVTASVAASLGVSDQVIEDVQRARVGTFSTDAVRRISSFAAPPVLRVRFAAQGPGALTTRLQYAIRWTDGHLEHGTVVVRARACDLVDAPSRPLDDRPSPIEVPAGPGAIPEPASAQPTSASLDDAAAEARDAAASIAASQALGVDVARLDSRAFKRQVTPGPWWAALAEIALSAGIAGIAGVIAKHVGARLKEIVASSATKVAESLPDAAKVVAIEAPGAASRAAFQKAAADYLVAGITDSVKDGLKNAGKRAIAGRSKPSVRPQAVDPTRHSSNDVTNFWADQTAMLNDVHDHNRAIITDITRQLRPIAATNPSQAAAALEAVADALRATKKSAEQTQALASTTQWIAGIAQSSHGTEKVVVPSGEARTVTSLAGERADLHRGKPDGVLRIAVEIPPHMRELSAIQVAVKRARLLGVSQESADRLVGVPLVNVGVPMLIDVRTVGGETVATITRDEVGRVRIDGMLPLGDTAGSPWSEATHARAASQLVDIVLSKDLASYWELDEIETNDASGRNSQ